jgi:hypothetical protein
MLKELRTRRRSRTGCGFHILGIERRDWGIGGHREWARSYISALDEIEPAGRRFP